jgi:fluoroacetyl-CoA thioesterase
MQPTLKPGDRFELEYVVPDNKTVPHLYPESGEFQKMPQVFATGFMVGLIEWCCIEALHPHLEAGESSLGTYIETTHAAPTPPGMKVTVSAVCTEVRNGNNVFWSVTARDEVDEIAKAVHGRHVVARGRFDARVARKRDRMA